MLNFHFLSDERVVDPIKQIVDTDEAIFSHFVRLKKAFQDALCSKD